MKRYKVTDILETLNKLASHVEDNISYVNYGGCCVFASIVGRHLEKRGINVHGIVGANLHYKPSIHEIRENVKNNHSVREWDENGIYFNHVALSIRPSIREYHYDSHGAIRPNGFIDGCALYKGKFTVDELESFAKSYWYWNNAFSRKQIPKLKKIVKNHFEALDKKYGA